jgi:beta-glucosidase
LNVTNTGGVAGREVVQFYTGLPGSAVARPPRQLAGFASVDLQPGETAAVQVLLQRDDLVYWDVRVDDWVLEPGEYRVAAGSSSRDIRLTATVSVEGRAVELPLTLQSSIADVAADPEALQRLLALVGGAMPDLVGAESTDSGIAAMMASIPIGRLTMFAGGKITAEQLQRVIGGGGVSG